MRCGGWDWSPCSTNRAPCSSGGFSRTPRRALVGHGGIGIGLTAIVVILGSIAWLSTSVT